MFDQFVCLFQIDAQLFCQLMSRGSVVWHCPIGVSISAHQKVWQLIRCHELIDIVLVDKMNVLGLFLM